MKMSKDSLWKYWDSIFKTQKQLDDEILRTKWSMNTSDPFIRKNARNRYRALKEYRDFRLSHANQLSFMDELGV